MEHDDITYPGPSPPSDGWNCRCVALFDVDWRTDIAVRLDQLVGCTAPRLPEFHSHSLELPVT